MDVQNARSRNLNRGAGIQRERPRRFQTRAAFMGPRPLNWSLTGAAGSTPQPTGKSFVVELRRKHARFSEVVLQGCYGNLSLPCC